MKKLKKKFNKILKVFLALGLLFNNLMPLSVVFADELDNNDEVAITEKTDDDVTLPTEGEEEKNPAIDTNTEQGEEENLGEEVNPTEEEPTVEPTEEVAFTYEVYADDNKFEDDYGWVELDKEVKKVDIVAKLSGVEATENYKFTFEGTEYSTEDLLNGVVVKSITFDGYLYGVFELEITGTLTDPEGATTPYEISYGIQHGTDADNDDVLSAVNSDYIFKEGVLTSTVYDEDTLTGIVKEAFPNATAEFEDNDLYLSDDHGVMAWYGIVTKGDVNGDGKINEEDLELLINQILGLEEVNENSDVNGDGEVNDLDAEHLKLMLETGYTGDVTKGDAAINAKFDEFSQPVKVGDEFTLDYIVTLSEYTINGISGLVKYDKNLLELVSASTKVFNLGDMNEDKFLYLGDYLELDIEPVEDEEGNIIFDEDGSPKLIFNDTDYVVVSLTFKALAAGDATVSMDELKYFEFDEYYTPDGETSINVTIEGEEEESPFESITVSGYDVDLSTYELTVPNEVTTLDLEYILANDGYSVTSVLAPEELAEGENTIVITLTDENGEEKTYTIKVTREAKEEEKKEETVAPVSYTEPTYDNNDDNDDDEKVAPVTDDNDDNEEIKDEDNGKLSRVIIIILILLAIAGLIYLIFKDDKDDEETKKANRDIDKLKKEDDMKRKHEDDKKVKKKGR